MKKIYTKRTNVFIRIISLSLTILMLLGSFSIMGSAKECNPETHMLTYHHIETTIGGLILDITPLFQSTDKATDSESLEINLPNGSITDIKFYCQTPSPANRHIDKDIPAPENCNNWESFYTYYKIPYTENWINIKVFYCAGCSSECADIQNANYAITLPDVDFHESNCFDITTPISCFNGWVHSFDGKSYILGDVYNKELTFKELLEQDYLLCENLGCNRKVYHGIYEKDDENGNPKYLIGVLNKDEINKYDPAYFDGCYNYNIEYNKYDNCYDVYCNGHDVCIGHQEGTVNKNIIINFCNDVPYCSESDSIFSFLNPIKEFFKNIFNFLFSYWF